MQIFVRRFLRAFLKRENYNLVRMQIFSRRFLRASLKQENYNLRAFLNLFSYELFLPFEFPVVQSKAFTSFY